MRFKKSFSNLELEGQGRGIIMGLTCQLLLAPFYTIQTKTDQTFWRGVYLWSQKVCRCCQIYSWTWLFCWGNKSAFFSKSKYLILFCRVHLSAWKHIDHPNMKLLRYEDMKKYLISTYLLLKMYVLSLVINWPRTKLVSLFLFQDASILGKIQICFYIYQFPLILSDWKFTKNQYTATPLWKGERKQVGHVT